METIDTKQLLKDINKVILNLVLGKRVKAFKLLWKIKENLSKVNENKSLDKPKN